MSRKTTIIWGVRVVGVVMMLVFTYLLCSMQNQLSEMEQRRGGTSRPAPPPPDSTPDVD